MRVLYLCTVAVTLLLVSEAANPKKKKFEGDFEFAEDSVAEQKSKDVQDRKTWISDPTSDLCRALKCRKDERCLLEDSFTAVCVSKSELRRNGDLIVSKTKYESTSTTTKPADYDDEDDEYDDDDDTDSENPDPTGKESNNVNDDLGLEFYDLDINVDEDGSSKRKSKTTTTTTTPKYAILKRCNPCPVVKPTYICGTNNMTYSSLCKLDYFNCMNDGAVQVACKGFCPCPGQWSTKKQSKEMRLADFENKFKATVEREKTLKFIKDAKVIFSPGVAKLKDELFGKNNKAGKNKNNQWAKNSVLTSDDKQKELGFNDVLPEKKTTDFAGCNEAAMETMGNRLLDWFSVLMSQPRGTKQQKIIAKAKGHFPSTCAKEVKWMFSFLDSDHDSQLSLAELYDMEHNERETCLKPFVDRCDENRDVFLSTAEWCHCFARAERPCLAVRRHTKGIAPLLGSFVPRCDGQGFYQPLQCHGATGTCWCVDSHGVEQTGSRTRGRPDCESILKKNGVGRKENGGGRGGEDLDDSNEVEESSGDGGNY